MIKNLESVLYGFSDVAIVLSVCILYVFSGLMIYWALFLFFPKIQKKPDPYWGATILGTVLSVNAMLLIFTLIQCVNSLHAISDVVGAEVASLHRFEKAITSLSSPETGKVQHSLKTYVQAVVATEWKLMGSTQRDVDSERTFDDLVMNTLSFSHRPQKDNVSGTIITQLLYDLMDARHDRLLKKNASLPLFYFEAIFLLEIVLVGKHFLNAGKDTRAILNLALHLCMLGTLLGLIVVYDHPFMGDSSVTDQGYRDFLTPLGG